MRRNVNLMDLVKSYPAIFKESPLSMYIQWEEILNIFHWEEILNMFNGKKSLIFSMGRHPQYFQREEILNIFNGKKSSIFSLGRNPQIIFLMGTVANPIGRVTLWFKSYNSVFNIHTHT